MIEPHFENSVERAEIAGMLSDYLFGVWHVEQHID